MVETQAMAAVTSVDNVGFGNPLTQFYHAGKLLLTLCKPIRTGGQPLSYPHTVIPFQASYEVI